MARLCVLGLKLCVLICPVGLCVVTGECSITYGVLVCSHDLFSQWNSVQSKLLEAWVVPIIDDPAVLELFSSQWRGAIRNTVLSRWPVQAMPPCSALQPPDKTQVVLLVVSCFSFWSALHSICLPCAA